ncbi:hypothetical protein HDU82_003941 [Entophlyctis luteolus]|nr:hypothetical protein HDU82_003941 [Entophlyctis luteolus]
MASPPAPPPAHIRPAVEAALLRLAARAMALPPAPAPDADADADLDDSRAARDLGSAQAVAEFQKAIEDVKSKVLAMQAYYKDVLVPLGIEATPDELKARLAASEVELRDRVNQVARYRDLVAETIVAHSPNSRDTSAQNA